MRLNPVDPALHIPLALGMALAFKLDPGIGAALFLWVREAAQRNPGNIIDGMKLWKYSLQKHAEIWPPAFVVWLVFRFL